MKCLILILLSTLIASCGKDAGSPGSGGPRTDVREEQQGPTEQASDEYLDISESDSIDLLNVTMSERVTLTGTEVTFRRPLNITESGAKISCSISIASGETWHLNQSGNKLQLTLPGGNQLDLQRVNGNGNIMGAWIWRGNENGIKMIKRYTFLPGQIVLNQDCEG